MASCDYGGSNYERHTALLRRYFRRRLSNSTDVDDLVQETLRRFFGRSQHDNGATRLLFGIARNLCFEHWRRRRRDARINESARSLAKIPRTRASVALWNEEIRAKLDDAVQRVRTPHKEALEMFYLHKMKYRTIAEKIGVPQSTVATWLRRGREELRAILWDLMQGDPGARGHET